MTMKEKKKKQRRCSCVALRRIALRCGSSDIVTLPAQKGSVYRGRHLVSLHHFLSVLMKKTQSERGEKQPVKTFNYVSKRFLDLFTFSGVRMSGCVHAVVRSSKPRPVPTHHRHHLHFSFCTIFLLFLFNSCRFICYLGHPIEKLDQIDITENLNELKWIIFCARLSYCPPFLIGRKTSGCNKTGEKIKIKWNTVSPFSPLVLCVCARARVQREPNNEIHLPNEIYNGIMKITSRKKGLYVCVRRVYVVLCSCEGGWLDLVVHCLYERIMLFCSYSIFHTMWKRRT